MPRGVRRSVRARPEPSSSPQPSSGTPSRLRELGHRLVTLLDVALSLHLQADEAEQHLGVEVLALLVDDADHLGHRGAFVGGQDARALRATGRWRSRVPPTTRIPLASSVRRKTCTAQRAGSTTARPPSQLPPIGTWPERRTSLEPGARSSATPSSPSGTGGGGGSGHRLHRLFDGEAPRVGLHVEDRRVPRPLAGLQRDKGAVVGEGEGRHLRAVAPHEVLPRPARPAAVAAEGALVADHAPLDPPHARGHQCVGHLLERRGRVAGGRSGPTGSGRHGPRGRRRPGCGPGRRDAPPSPRSCGSARRARRRRAPPPSSPASRWTRDGRPSRRSARRECGPVFRLRTSIPQNAAAKSGRETIASIALRRRFGEGSAGSDRPAHSRRARRRAPSPSRPDHGDVAHASRPPVPRSPAPRSSSPLRRARRRPRRSGLSRTTAREARPAPVPAGGSAGRAARRPSRRRATPARPGRRLRSRGRSCPA